MNMQEKNLLSPSRVAPEPLPSQCPGNTSPSSVGNPPFSRALLPRMRKENRGREMRRILSPRGHEESNFRTLMRILGKGENESSEILEDSLRGLPNAPSTTLPAIKGRRGRLMPNSETLRETAPSSFPSGRKESGTGQTPKNKDRREDT